MSKTLAASQVEKLVITSSVPPLTAHYSMRNETAVLFPATDGIHRLQLVFIKVI